MDFEVVDNISGIETIATGSGIRKRFGQGRWRKRKGYAESILSQLAKSPDGHLAHCILGVDVPSDQCVTGTMITLKASGESSNCEFSIGGAPGRSAPHVEPCPRGK